MQKLDPPLALEKLESVGKLGKIPSWFGSLPNLTKLVLCYNEFDEERFLKLPRVAALQNSKIIG
ncbi:hypothetical protein AMTR_s00090p00091770 [Amborella trichopoda]|uniref:Uncharacterized protein n=1 Tax=Amborella trichopoda TaxID=13333 RepID=W1P3V3_AMBTC|nr:hypothetical protein AMTR_s00090p00091770 [Amborella trichopoda]